MFRFQNGCRDSDDEEDGLYGGLADLEPTKLEDHGMYSGVSFTGELRPPGDDDPLYGGLSNPEFTPNRPIVIKPPLAVKKTLPIKSIIESVNMTVEVENLKSDRETAGPVSNGMEDSFLGKEVTSFLCKDATSFLGKEASSSFLGKDNFSSFLCKDDSRSFLCKEEDLVFPKETVEGPENVILMKKAENISLPNELGIQGDLSTFVVETFVLQPQMDSPRLSENNLDDESIPKNDVISSVGETNMEDNEVNDGTDEIRNEIDQIEISKDVFEDTESFDKQPKILQLKKGDELTFTRPNVGIVLNNELNTEKLGVSLTKDNDFNDLGKNNELFDFGQRQKQNDAFSHVSREIENKFAAASEDEFESACEKDNLTNDPLTKMANCFENVVTLNRSATISPEDSMSSNHEIASFQSVFVRNVMNQKHQQSLLLLQPSDESQTSDTSSSISHKDSNSSSAQIPPNYFGLKADLNSDVDSQKDESDSVSNADPKYSNSLLKKHKNSRASSGTSESSGSPSEDQPVRRSNRIKSLEEKKELKQREVRRPNDKQSKHKKKSLEGDKQSTPKMTLQIKTEEMQQSDHLSTDNESNAVSKEITNDYASNTDASGNVMVANRSETVEPVSQRLMNLSLVSSTELNKRMEELDANKRPPEKVKSRWRRNSELERVLVNHEPIVPEANTQTQTPALDGAVVSFKNTSETRTVKMHVQTPGPADSEEQEKMPFYEPLTENLFLFERRRCKSKKEVRRMVCDCTLTKEEKEHGSLGCLDDCLNRLLMIECGSRCLVGNACANKRFYKKQYSNIGAFKTEKKGWGLRALESLEGGAFVMEYIGEVLSPVEFKQRVKHYAREKYEHYYFMALKGDEIIDATCKGNVSRFINHSCDPNCETQKWTVNGELRIGFFTTKDVKPFEELTFDYQFQRYGREAQRCYCESSNCRGYIGESGEEKRVAIKSVKSPSQKRKRNEDRVKKEEPEDLALEEELKKLCSIGGLKNREQTLMLARLMVRAETLDSRQRLLSIIQNTTEQACLRLFLDYHGLTLLWSWMVDLGDDAIELKTQILEILAFLPINNKTMLLDSKVMSVVQKWAIPPPVVNPVKALQGISIIDDVLKEVTKGTDTPEQSSSGPPSGATTPSHGDCPSDEIFNVPKKTKIDGEFIVKNETLISDDVVPNDDEPLLPTPTLLAPVDDGHLECQMKDIEIIDATETETLLVTQEIIAESLEMMLQDDEVIGETVIEIEIQDKMNENGLEVGNMEMQVENVEDEIVMEKEDLGMELEVATPSSVLDEMETESPQATEEEIVPDYIDILLESEDLSLSELVVARVLHRLIAGVCELAVPPAITSPAEPVAMTIPETDLNSIDAKSETVVEISKEAPLEVEKTIPCVDEVIPDLENTIAASSPERTVTSSSEDIVAATSTLEESSVPTLENPLEKALVSDEIKSDSALPETTPLVKPISEASENVSSPLAKPKLSAKSDEVNSVPLILSPPVVVEEQKVIIDIASLASDLLLKWANLKEVFRIPRLEHQKRKEDERAAGGWQDRHWNNSPSRRRDYERECIRERGRDYDSRRRDRSPRNDRYRLESEDYLNRMREERLKRQLQHASPPVPAAPKLSKEQRRQLFALEVQQRDEEEAFKRQQEYASLEIAQQTEFLIEYGAAAAAAQASAQAAAEYATGGYPPNAMDYMGHPEYPGGPPVEFGPGGQMMEFGPNGQPTVEFGPHPEYQVPIEYAVHPEYTGPPPGTRPDYVGFSRHPEYAAQVDYGIASDYEYPGHPQYVYDPSGFHPATVYLHPQSSSASQQTQPPPAAGAMSECNPIEVITSIKPLLEPVVSPAADSPGNNASLAQKLSGFTEVNPGNLVYPPVMAQYHPPVSYIPSSAVCSTPEMVGSPYSGSPALLASPSPKPDSSPMASSILQIPHPSLIPLPPLELSSSCATTSSPILSQIPLPLPSPSVSSSPIIQPGGSPLLVVPESMLPTQIPMPSSSSSLISSPLTTTVSILPQHHHPLPLALLHPPHALVHPPASPSPVPSSPILNVIPSHSVPPSAVTSTSGLEMMLSPLSNSLPTFVTGQAQYLNATQGTPMYYVQSTGAVVTIPDQSSAVSLTELATEENVCFQQLANAVSAAGAVPIVHVATVAPSTVANSAAVASLLDSEAMPPPPTTPKPQKLPPNWKTAKDSEGNTYFYHSITRQTQWDPPEVDYDDESNMDLGTPTFDEPKHSKKRTTTAPADTSSELAKRIKENFRSKMSSYVVQCLNPFRKPDCKLGRISSTEDFKHLARKLTHFVMAKELKHCKNVEDLECNENVKHKAKDFVQKYMNKFGADYRKDKSSPRDY